MVRLTVTGSPGLSPRVWGNPGARAARGRWPGSIPTRVGKPDAVCAASDGLRVYPHACGETLVPSRTMKRTVALSPAVRPHLGASGGESAGAGSIPTRVGKPFLTSYWCDIHRVYPHACGETVRP